MKTLVVAILVIALTVVGVRFYNLYCQDVDLGNKVALVKGECVVIDWYATEDQACWALAKWQAMKNQAK